MNQRPSLHPWHHPARAGSTDLSASVGSGPLQWCGIDVITLQAGEQRRIETGSLERSVVSLSGRVSIEFDNQRHDLRDRGTVFRGVSDFAYIGIDNEFVLTATTDTQVAIPHAIADQRHPAVFVQAESVPIELRGAGQATRQVNNFMSPDVFSGAHRLMCVEVLTPDGNWSSYPPHRHDGIGDCAVNNEEVYYFRIGELDGSYSQHGFGMHRTYTVPEPGKVEVDVNVPVYDGDGFLIPRGYHGPCVAAPGYPMYYLNVLAGPSGERTMAFCDDPSHHWVRETWAEMATDPRLPMTSAAGSTGNYAAHSPQGPKGTL
jgi:5-deoxy-glucuronate isomerase